MLNNFTKIFKSQTAKNGVWLYIFQFFNLIIPLITIPYLSRVLSQESNGIFNSALNITAYLEMVVAYGFDLMGAKKISISSKEEIPKIYTGIFFSKLFFMGISFVVMSVMTLGFKFPVENYLLMGIMFTLVIGTMLQHNWLFQGLQKMKFVTITNVITKSLSVLCIFLLIKKPDQYLLYSFLYCITFLLTGVISTIIIKYGFKIRLEKFSFSQMKKEIIDSFHTFLTSAMSKIYSGIAVTVLIIFTNDDIVGGFSMVYKLPLVTVMMFSPIFQTVFPFLSKKYNESFDSGYSLVKKMVKIIMPLAILGCAILAVFSKPIVSLVLGEDYISYHNILLPLSIWVILSIFNNFLGIQILVASGHPQKYSFSFLFGFITILICCPLFGYLWGPVGVSYGTMIAEAMLTIICTIMIIKTRKELNYEKSNVDIRN